MGSREVTDYRVADGPDRSAGVVGPWRGHRRDFWRQEAVGIGAIIVRIDVGGWGSKVTPIGADSRRLGDQTCKYTSARPSRPY